MESFASRSLLLIVVGCCQTVLVFGIAHSRAKRDYCEWEVFNATCDQPDQVVVITGAKYGRMRIGECITSNYGHIGCATDVTADLEKLCSGRRHCLVNVISLHDKRSCPKDFKSYLEVDFDCLGVDRLGIHQSDDGHQSTVVVHSITSVSESVSDNSPPQSLHGILSSSAWRDVISSGAVGGQQLGTGQLGQRRVMAGARWTVCAEPFQRINVTLVDFSVESTSSSNSLANPPNFSAKSGWTIPGPAGISSCSVPLAVVSENQTTTDRRARAGGNGTTVDGDGFEAAFGRLICGGRSRLNAVYVSTTNCLTVRINETALRRSGTEFLIMYEAFGCSPLASPPGVWLEVTSSSSGGGGAVDGNERGINCSSSSSSDRKTTTTGAAVFRCNETEEAWHLLCRGTQWIGNIGNCSSPANYWKYEDTWTFEKLLTNSTHFPYGIVAVVCLGIALGVTVGILLLAIVIAYMRRRRRWKARQRLKQALASTTDSRRASKNSKDHSFMSILHERSSSSSKSADRRRSAGHHHEHHRRSATADSGAARANRVGGHTDIRGGSATTNTGYRGCCSSWQRVRPLPVPQSPDDGPPPTVASPSGPQQPLLSSISLGVSGGGGGRREHASTFVAAFDNRAVSRSDDGEMNDRGTATMQQRLRRGRSPTDPLPDFAPALPPPPPAEHVVEDSANSPYYFQLDPALTRNRHAEERRLAYSELRGDLGVGGGCCLCQTGAAMTFGDGELPP